MPVTGRPPKVDAEGRPIARHRNQPTHEWVEVQNVPYTPDGPDKPGRKLPRHRVFPVPAVIDDAGVEVSPASKTKLVWPERTKDWWTAVSTMPHCALWEESDWQYAIDAAMLHAEVVDGDFRLAPALERREKVMGTTADFRRGLRIRYVDPVPTGDATSTGGSVANLDDYRDLYGEPGGD